MNQNSFFPEKMNQNSFFPDPFNFLDTNFNTNKIIIQDFLHIIFKAVCNSFMYTFHNNLEIKLENGRKQTANQSKRK